MNDPAAIIEVMRSDLDRFGNQLGARATALAREAIVDLRRDLDRPHLGPWGIAQKVATMAQVRSAVEQLAARQAAVLTGAVRPVSETSQRRMVALLNVLDTRFAGAATPLRFDTLAWVTANARQLSRSRLREYSASFARYGAAAVTEIEGELAKLALTGQPWTKARPRVHAAIRDVVGDRQWMVDRILRTETSAIYNGTALAAMIEEDTPDSPMLKRLISTFDRATGADSRAVHGQVRPVREPFSDGKRLYMAPPNRPHDREIVVPHRARWGPNLPRLTRPPPAPAETSAPDLPAARPAAAPPPALAGRLASAAAAVTIIAGRLQERRRLDRSLPTDARGERPVMLERELSDAMLRLAGARLAADVAAGEGTVAGQLRRGEVVTAGGLAVRVVGLRNVGAAVQLELAVGEQRLQVELPAAIRLPLRRDTPTLKAEPRQARDALAMLAEAIRQSVAPSPEQRTSANRTVAQLR